MQTDELAPSSTGRGGGHGGGHGSGGVLNTPPWRRAPLLVARQPPVFLALALAAAVLALAAASGPLFLAATGTAALHISAARSCPEQGEAGLSVAGDAAATQFENLLPTGQLTGTDRIVRSAAARAGLPAPYLTVGTTINLAPSGPNAPRAVDLFSRPGALDHVQKLTPAGRAGVWITDTVASNEGLRPGSTIKTFGGIRLPVAGIFRDLIGRGIDPHLPRYWCSWSTQIAGSGANAAPPFFIADLATLTRSTPYVAPSWFAPIDVGHITVPQARTASVAVASVPPAVTTATGGQVRLFVHPDLGELVRQATLVHSGLRGPIIPIDIAGAIVALLLVGGAAGFWVVRRAPELRLLVSRGVGPVALAIKALLEIAPAVIVGGLAGWGGAIVLVRSIGPSSMFEPGAPVRSLAAAAAACAAGLVLVAVIGAAAAREPRAGRGAVRVLAWLPWELALLAAAFGVYLAVHRHGAVHSVHGTVQVHPTILAFPLLLLAGGVLLLCRLAGLGLPALRRATTPLGIAVYLAVRRITGTAGVAIALAVGTALPCGILVYAAAQTASVDHSVSLKFDTYLGAPHALGTLADPDSTIPLAGHGTQVAVVSTDAFVVGGNQIQMIGVDPATFARFSFSDPQVAAAIRGLTPPVDGGPAPALWVNAHGARAPKGVRYVDDTVRTVHIVGRLDVFPGLRDGYSPMLVVNRRAFLHLSPFVHRDQEVWTTDDQLAAARAALTRHGIAVLFEISPTTFLDHTDLLPVTWIFSYLRVLAVLAGLVAIAGLVFALAARTRRRTSSYVLTARMGIGRGSHRRSIVIELVLVVGFGWLAGAAVALTAAASIYRRFDVNSSFPPPPSLSIPVMTLVASGAGVVVVVLLAAAVTQWLADRADPSEVMRLE
ncbi:MAG: hypothetical protein DLM56_05170 [Pseudonocardiales bacterium]|nr:MAG: hypothetical protein DLM56_05170 [Pseudonocardiales bacterium]